MLTSAIIQELQNERNQYRRVVTLARHRFRGVPFALCLPPKVRSGAFWAGRLVGRGSAWGSSALGRGLVCWGQAGDTQSSSCHFSLGPGIQMLLQKGCVHLLQRSGVFSLLSLCEDRCELSSAQTSCQSARSNRLERRMDEGDACARPLLYTGVIDVIFPFQRCV